MPLAALKRNSPSGLRQCSYWITSSVFFFFQAEDGIRDGRVTGVQTCALPISKVRQEFRVVGNCSHQFLIDGDRLLGLSCDHKLSCLAQFLRSLIGLSPEGSRAKQPRAYPAARLGQPQQARASAGGETFFGRHGYLSPSGRLALASRNLS